MAFPPKKPTSLALNEDKGLKKKKSFQFKSFDMIRKLMKLPNKNHLEDELVSPSSISPSTSFLPATQQHRQIVGSTHDMLHMASANTPTEENKASVKKQMSLSVDNVFTAVQGGSGGGADDDAQRNNSSNRNSNSNTKYAKNEFASKKHRRNKSRDFILEKKVEVVEKMKINDKEREDLKDDNDDKRDGNDDGLPQSPFSPESKNTNRLCNSPSFDSGHCRLSEDSSEDNLGEDPFKQLPQAVARKGAAKETSKEEAADLEALQGVQKLDMTAAKHRRLIRPTGRRAVTVFRTTPIPQTLAQVEEECMSFASSHKNFKKSSTQVFNHKLDVLKVAKTEAEGGEKEKKGEDAQEEKKDKRVIVLGVGAKIRQEEVEVRAKPSKADLLRNKAPFVVNLAEIQEKRKTIALLQTTPVDDSPTKETGRNELTEMFNRLQAKSFRGKASAKEAEQGKETTLVGKDDVPPRSVAFPRKEFSANKDLLPNNETSVEASKKSVLVQGKGDALKSLKPDVSRSEKKAADEKSAANGLDSKPFVPKPSTAASFKSPRVSSDNTTNAPPIIAAKPDKFVRRVGTIREVAAPEKAAEADSEPGVKEPLWKLKSLEGRRGSKKEGQEDSDKNHNADEVKAKLKAKFSVLGGKEEKASNDFPKLRSLSEKAPSSASKAGVGKTFNSTKGKNVELQEKPATKPEVFALKPKVAFEKPALKASKVEQEAENARASDEFVEGTKKPFGAFKLNKVNSDAKENTSHTPPENADKAKFVARVPRERKASESDKKEVSSDCNNSFLNLKLNSVALSGAKSPKQTSENASNSKLLQSLPHSSSSSSTPPSSAEASKKDIPFKAWQQPESSTPPATKKIVPGAFKFSSVKETSASKPLNASIKPSPAKGRVLPPGVKSIPPPSFLSKHASNN